MSLSPSMTPAWSRFPPSLPNTRTGSSSKPSCCWRDGSSKAGPCLSQPAAVRDYLRLKLVAEPNEIFAMCSWTASTRCWPTSRCSGARSTRLRSIRVSSCSVLELNAAAVVFAHQHPSGVSEPSSADRMLTQQLQAALALIDVRVLDHIIVGQGALFSLCGIRPAVAMAPAP